uniref:Arrestin C-terminal-like domain-containing protein n=1 Tax=Acrobeloides nanus TaxID=290746 RepID=A0A914DHB8_9BILA
MNTLLGLSIHHIQEFSIELEKKDGCFNPGDLVSGRIVVKARQNIELEQVTVLLYGSAKPKGRVRTADSSTSNTELIYIHKILRLLSSSQNLNSNVEEYLAFEESLPLEIPTSVESKSASILYLIKAQLVFKTEENETKTVTAIRGITIVEPFDLNILPPRYFEPPTYHLAKKFGLFSCTGGSIKLTFTICRLAFVCGENISIEGRIENKTDRRVDKVAAVLQQVIMVMSEDESSEANILDVSDIHEDNLALFVDEGSSIKIERNFPIPPLPPSTFVPNPPELLENRPLIEMPSKKRMSFSSSRLSIVSASNKLALFPTRNARFLKVLYQLSVKVKTGGVEVMEINVPLIIGTLPYDYMLPKMHSKDKCKEKEEINASLKSPIYKQNRKDRPVSLCSSNEIYLCSRTQLNFVNKYPFYPNLPTSSKQSQKLNKLATAIKVETNLINGLRRENDEEESLSSETTVQLPNVPIED